MKRHLRGVTLIELMIVIVVVAILASVALPSYRRYMMRTNRTDATAALLQLRIAQEKFFLQNDTYATTTAQVLAAPPGGLGIPSPTANGYYTISLQAGASPTSYTAQAAPAGGQVADTQCTLLTINESGVRNSTPSPITTCWR